MTGKNKTSITYLLLWRQNDWGFYYRRHEAFARHLSEIDGINRVVHVEEITLKAFFKMFIRWAQLPGLRQSIAFQIRKTLSLKPVRVSNRLFVFSVCSLKGSSGGALDRISNLLIQLQLKMMRLDDKNRVMVVYPPSRLGAIASRQIAYDCLIADLVDDVIAREASQERAQFYFDNYCEILPKCNWIISTGESLKRYEPLAGQPINVFPNGVNTDEYEAVDRTDFKHKVSRKIVGYVGSINRTMDINVVKKCLQYFNGTDFVFYGFIGDSQGTTALREFKKQANFYFKGELHYQQVPNFLKSCDVLIMPKKHDTATTGNDSIKIYQYLATGRPVVSTSVAPAPSFSCLIYVADTEDDFVSGIEAALNEKDTNIGDDRIHEAKKHSWKNKISCFHRTICNVLEKGQRTPSIKKERN